eukprot:Seg2810.1 transcript_id=Seg2810.1/GoldUCD/mRNA.D3Y31 product="hypothetical protein" protein_id=Seg2810.1/GoldUCD/D3Y31
MTTPPQFNAFLNHLLTGAGITPAFIPKYSLRSLPKTYTLNSHSERSQSTENLRSNSAPIVSTSQSSTSALPVTLRSRMSSEPLVTRSVGE